MCILNFGKGKSVGDKKFPGAQGPFTMKQQCKSISL